MKTLTASKARAQWYTILDNVADEPLLIKGKRNSAVLVSETDWRALQEMVCSFSTSEMQAK